MRWRSERTSGSSSLAAFAGFALAWIATACGDTDGGRALSSASTPSAAGSAAPVAATVVVSVGNVRARQAAAAAWAPAHAGLPLHAHDAIQTMGASHAAIRFAEDDTIAELEPNTTLEIPAQRPAEVRLRHISGRIVARLPADAEPGRRVEIDLPPGTLRLDANDGAGGAARSAIEARVDVTPHRTEIVMVEGRGRLSSRSGRTVTIERSRYLRIDRDGTVVAGGLLAAAALVEPRADAIVRTRDTVRFSWRAAAGATSYRAQATRADGVVVETIVAAPAIEASLQLTSGRYAWTVEPLAEAGATEGAERRTLTVELDRAPPLLVIESPAAGASTRDSEVIVRGRTEPSAHVDVEGRATQVRRDGTFEVRVAVPRGLANLVIRATDDLGNVRAASRTVIRE